MPPIRRLAAILASDVAGYSRLMGADEEGTHETPKAHLRELVNPKIEEHKGRIVRNTGDGCLAEFASVVDAMRWAVEVQRTMADREPAVREDRRIRFRIGVNLGDVIATAMAFRRAFEAPTHLYTMIAGNGLEPGADLLCKGGDNVGIAGLYTPVQLQSVAEFAR
jgi:class 3 adenylate cyclase